MSKYKGYVYVQGYISVEVVAENEQEAIDNAYEEAISISGLSKADADVIYVEVAE